MNWLKWNRTTFNSYQKKRAILLLFHNTNSTNSIWSENFVLSIFPTSFWFHLRSVRAVWRSDSLFIFFNFFFSISFAVPMPTPRWSLALYALTFCLLIFHFSTGQIMCADVIAVCFSHYIILYFIMKIKLSDIFNRSGWWDDDFHGIRFRCWFITMKLSLAFRSLQSIFCLCCVCCLSLFAICLTLSVHIIEFGFWENRPFKSCLFFFKLRWM